MPNPASETYLDTSSFLRVAEATASAVSERNRHIAPLVESVLEDAARRLITSETAILEFRNNVSLNLRDGAKPHFDQAWATGAVWQFMRRLSTGQVEIVPHPDNVTETACSLVSHATIHHGIGFRVWDAVHLVTACGVAATSASMVELITTDDDFDRFLRYYPHFGQAVSVKNLDPGGLSPHV